jgi:hypothetical protein
MPPSRCRPPEGGDALDQELANRLNSRLAATDRNSDHEQSLRPVFKEILYWSIATLCLTAAAMVWIV